MPRARRLDPAPVFRLVPWPVTAAAQASPMNILQAMPAARIGPHPVDPPFFLAPMAGVSEAPYRTMVLEMGAGLAPTELVSSRGLHSGQARTESYLRHDPQREPLLTVQLYGGDPTAMADAAAQAVDRGAKIIDVNMGCPVKKITKNQAGSALMKDPDRAVAVVEAMVRRVGHQVPVTVKLRAGWDDSDRNAPELGRRLAEVGAAALALHPRTRQQGYEGAADWSLIARLKEAVPDLCVVANGDVDGRESAAEVVRRTGCDAVMVGRAALGNPWIFRDLARARAGQEPVTVQPAERVESVLRHFREGLEHAGSVDRGLKKFRQHLIWYSRGLMGNVRFREQVLQLDRAVDVEAAIMAFFSQARSAESEAAEYDARRAYG